MTTKPKPMREPISPEQSPDDFLADCVRIEPLALNEEYIRLPSDYAFWAEKYRVALERHLLAKAERERSWSKFYLHHSATYGPNGKPATVDYIKASIDTESEYVGAVTEAIYAEGDMTKMRNVLEAIRSKREMLVSLGATIRQEMSQDPVVRERERNKRYSEDG